MGNKEIDLRKKNLLSWQNIWNSRQIAADIEEKLANQGEVHRGGISPIYLSLWNKWEPCHGAINSRPHVISERHWKSTFDFREIVKKLRVEVRRSITSCEIYFPVFSETIYAILKIFSQHGLKKCR